MDVRREMPIISTEMAAEKLSIKIARNDELMNVCVRCTMICICKKMRRLDVSSTV